MQQPSGTCKSLDAPQHLYVQSLGTKVLGIARKSWRWHKLRQCRSLGGLCRCVWSPNKKSVFSALISLASKMCCAPCREVDIPKDSYCLQSPLSIVQGKTCVAKQHRNGLWTIDFGNQFPLFLVGTSAKIHQKQSWHSKFVCCVNILASHLTTQPEWNHLFIFGGPWFAPIKNWRDAGELQTHTQILYIYIINK